MLKAIGSLLLIALAGSLGAAENDRQPAPEYHWPMYKGGAGYSGYSAESIVVKPPLKLVWSYRLDSRCYASPVIGAGRIFIFQEDLGALTALDAESGRLLWESAGVGGGGRTGPAYSNGKVFTYGKGERSVVALDAATGKIVWSHELSKPNVNGQRRLTICAENGFVYVVEGQEDPAVKALSEATGELVWATKLGSEQGAWTIPPTASGGRVFVALRKSGGFSRKVLGGKTLALDGKSGKVLWTRENIYPWVPVTSDGKVVACPMIYSPTEHLHLLDAETGKTLWECDAQGRSPPTITPEFILVKDYGPIFTKVDRSTGKVLWTYREAGQTGCSTPSVSGNYAYFGTGSAAAGMYSYKPWEQEDFAKKSIGNNLTCVDLATGKAAWTFHTGGNICGDPAVTGGRLFLAGSDGWVHCFEPAENGEPSVPDSPARPPTAEPEALRKLLHAQPESQPQPGRDWPMFGGNAERAAAHAPDLKLPLEPAWRLETGGRVLTAAAVFDGRAYVGSDGGALWAVDLASGKTAWTFKAGSAVRSSAAVAGGRVYAGTTGGRFVALDARSGEVLWTFQAGAGVRSAPAVAGDLVIFGADDGNLYCLNRVTGEHLWNFRTEHYRVQAPPVVTGETVLVANTWAQAIDVATGRERWRTYTPGLAEDAAYRDGKFWVGTTWKLSCVAALDAATGRPLSFADAPLGRARFVFQAGRIVTVGPAGPDTCDFSGDGKVLESERLGNPKIYGGKKLRGASSLGTVERPFAAKGQLIFGTRAGTLVVTDPDGNRLWSAQLGGSCHASPVAAAGYLLVGCDDGYLYAFREAK